MLVLWPPAAFRYGFVCAWLFNRNFKSSCLSQIRQHPSMVLLSLSLLHFVPQTATSIGDFSKNIIEMYLIQIEYVAPLQSLHCKLFKIMPTEWLQAYFLPFWFYFRALALTQTNAAADGSLTDSPSAYFLLQTFHARTALRPRSPCCSGRNGRILSRKRLPQWSRIKPDQTCTQLAYTGAGSNHLAEWRSAVWTFL